MMQLAVKKEFGFSLITLKKQLKDHYDAIVLTVSHREFKGFDLEKYTSETSVIFDVKSFFSSNKIDGRL